MRNHRARLAALGAVGLALAVWRPFPVAVDGLSMAPLVLPGDYLIAVRGRVGRGSLVVLEHPRRPGLEMVKRVAGVPGDDVNGRQLGPGEYWVTGTGEASTDSRSLGPIAGEAIRGVVRFRYWPPGRIRRFG
ncbi:MAG TPA: S26 family signal peptidase [Actinomycetota bacterium]